MGFVLVKKKKGKLYVDVYKTDSRMVQVQKKFSVELSQSICNVSMVLVEEHAIKRSTWFVTSD
jgi:hypothetical protein